MSLNTNTEVSQNLEDAAKPERSTKKSAKLTPVISIIDLRQNRVGEEILRMNPKVNHHWRGDLSTARELLAIAEKLRIPESMCAMLAIHEKAERMGLSVPAVRPSPIAPIASAPWKEPRAGVSAQGSAAAQPAETRIGDIPQTGTAGHVRAQAPGGDIPGVIISHEPMPEMEYWPEADEDDDTLGALRY